MMLKLSENQVALLLKYCPDDHFEQAVDRAKSTVRDRWATADNSKAAKFNQMQQTDAYEIGQLGFQIVPDEPRLVMACVTPIADGHVDDGPFDLRDITVQYVFDIKEETVREVNALRERTGLRPRLFVAAMVALNDEVEPGTDTLQTVARSEQSRAGYSAFETRGKTHQNSAADRF